MIPLVFIPWQVELWLLPSYVVVALLAFPGQAAGATFLVAVGTLMFTYEWVHFLVHSDYRPRTRPFRAVWRNHRLHHYKNEHYWFTVTTTSTADRLFRTYPDPATVKTSKTAKDLHGAGA
jgi:sterol desaturase/sphingolipid hydroxylase (fatty acid hydroxylase superfamily)